MVDKIIAISGANAGIGYATAKGLLQKGAKILMFCRNQQKAEEARLNLIKETGNENITIFIANMASFKSIENACNECKSKYDKIDVLINNAGATFSNFEKTEDGIEQTMAVNHFGYYLMTYHLLPLLVNAENARIVNVASKAHYGGNFDKTTINEEKGYSVFKQYEHSKLANVLFTKYLASKLSDKNITVNCLHPGVVKTKIGNKAGNKLHGFLWSLFAAFGINADKGAATSIYLASSSEVAETTGKYFDKCKGYEGSDNARSEILQKQLWDWTEKMTGVVYSF